MPLTYAGAASLRRGGLGWAATSAVAFFCNRLHSNPLPSPSSFWCVSSLILTILHPHDPHHSKLYSAYSASISFPFSPLTSFFAEPESGFWYVSWTLLLTTVCCGVGLLVCFHPLSLGNRWPVSRLFSGITFCSWK